MGGVGEDYASHVSNNTSSKWREKQLCNRERRENNQTVANLHVKCFPFFSLLEDLGTEKGNLETVGKNSIRMFSCEVLGLVKISEKLTLRKLVQIINDWSFEEFIQVSESQNIDTSEGRDTQQTKFPFPKKILLCLLRFTTTTVCEAAELIP